MSIPHLYGIKRDNDNTKIRFLFEITEHDQVRFSEAVRSFILWLTAVVDGGHDIAYASKAGVV